MFQIVILPAARQDIKDAAEWYNSRQNGLGRRFTTEVRNKVKFIAQNPLASPIRFDEVRIAVLNVFPFVIHYVVNENQQQLLIAAVFHTSRNPELGKSRTKAD